MNGDVIKEFLVGLGFQIDEQGLNNFNNGIAKASLVVTALGAASVAAAAGITKFVAGVAEKFDVVGDLADQVNTTAEAILELGYVAQLTGSSVQAAESSLYGLNKTAGEASLGIGRGAKIFEDLGLQAKDSNGVLKDTSVLMAEVGERIKDMARGEQLAVLSKLGIDPTLVNALTQDISGLSEEFQTLYKSVGIDANVAAEQAGEFNDSMDRMKFTMEAIKDSIGLKFMSQVRFGIDALRKFLVENIPKIINAVSPVIDIVLRIAEAFIIIAGRIGQVIGSIIGFLMRVNDATDGWAGYILAAAAAWKFLNLAFLTTPLGMILSLAAAIALLIDDFLVWKEGGESFINWDNWMPGFEAATSAINAFMSLLDGFFTLIFSGLDAVAQLLTGNFAGAWAAAGIWVESFIKILTSAWGIIKGVGDALGNFGGAIVGAFSGSTPALAPSPQAQASMQGSNQNVNQKTDIIIQGSKDPEATARYC